MNGAETITAKEVAEILNVSPRAVQIRAKNDGWVYETANARGDRRFILSQLPPEIQERIARYRLGIDADSIEEMASRCELVIDPAQIKNPQKAAKIKLVCECLAVPTHARGRDARIREIAESYGYNRATAYRLMERARNGLPLEKGSRNYGHTFDGLNITVRAWEPEAARIAIEAIAGNRHNRVEGQSLYIGVAAECERLKLRCGSLRSFYDLSGKIDPALLKYRDAGSRGLREDIIPSIRRDFTAYRAMECLIGDQHKADYYALDRAGNVVTLELFTWMDFRSQLCWGSIAYKHYNRYTVGSALLNAVRFGLPSMVYTDWGKPEESNYVSFLLEQLTGLGIEAQGIRHVNAIARNPQAKPIEGWHSWLDAKIKNERLPGFCKRLKDGRENELQQKEVKETIRAGGLLKIGEVTERVFSVIDNWNEHLFKNRGVDTGKSPLQVYREECQLHPVTTLSTDVLEYIFLPVHPATVKRSQVKIKHPWLRTLTYYSPDLSGYQGEAVDVRFDPFDQTRVFVFRKGQLLCRAEEWAMINPKVSDQVSQKIEAQRELERQVRDRYRAFAPVSENRRNGETGKRREEVDPKTGEVLSEDRGSGEPEKRRIGQIRRIHPQEREARAAAAADSEAIRVMPTPLDEDIRQVAHGAVVDLRTGDLLEEKTGELRPLFFKKEERPSGYRLPFKLNMDGAPGDDEEADDELV